MRGAFGQLGSLATEHADQQLGTISVSHQAHLVLVPMHNVLGTRKFRGVEARQSRCLPTGPVESS